VNALTQTPLRFEQVMDGQPAGRAPSAPKIWADLASRLTGVSFLDLLNDPALLMNTIVQAALLARADAARLFTFARRRVEIRDGRCLHIGENGRVLGAVDMDGGWATHFDDPSAVDISRPEVIADYGHFTSAQPPVAGPEDVDRIAVPPAAFYDEAGYGRMVEDARRLAAGKLALVGDCSSGTLAFLVAMRGMNQALLDLYDQPGLAQAVMEKGVALCVERAKFFLSHGVRLLRLNDSVANMSVISPAQWRQFIFPHFRRFCDEVHALSPHARIYCHICGAVLPIVKDLVETGLDCISPLDPLGGATVAQVRAAAGGKIALMGGVNTLSFVKSSREAITAEARRCIREGGARFIVGSGCALPRASKLENLQALAEAAEAEQRGDPQ